MAKKGEDIVMNFEEIMGDKKIDEPTIRQQIILQAFEPPEGNKDVLMEFINEKK